MERIVNEVMERLSHDIDTENLYKIKETIIIVLSDYEIHPKKHEVIARGNIVPDEVKHYIITKKIEGKSHNTLKQYMYALKRFFLYVDKPITDIKTDDIRLFLYKLMKDTNMTGVSIENQRLIICSFFKWLALNGYLDKDPSSPITRIKCEKKIREPLSDIEMEKMRIACKNAMEKAIIEVFYSTGCRVSELINIKISDINLDTKEVVLFGKGKKQRIAFLSARAVLNIKLLLNNRDFESEYVFSSDRKPHNKLGVRRIEVIVKDIGSRAGIKKRVFPHRIRHTTATDALKRGMDIEQVKLLLGHERIATTLEYAKISREDVKDKHSKYII